MLGAKRHQNGAGERREIDHETRFKARLGIPKHIRQNQPAFRIRIQNFNRLTGHGFDDVVGTLGIAVRHILDHADQADDVGMRFARGQGMHQPDNSGRTSHIAFHADHRIGGFERQSAGIEADAFTDEGQRTVLACFGTAAPIPSHHDEPRRVRAPLCHAEKRIHAELLHGRWIERLDGDAQFPQFLRPAGKFLRMRFVHQIAGKKDAVRHGRDLRPQLAGGACLRCRNHDFF